MSGWIPTPPARAERIALDTAGRLRVDLAPLRALVGERLAAASDGTGIIGAESAARDVLRQSWTPARAGEIGRALEAVRGEYAGAGAAVGTAIADLLRCGPESWAARAVHAQLAFHIGWDVLDERGELHEL